jgi:hypothetical protein
MNDELNNPVGMAVAECESEVPRKAAEPLAL